MTLRLKLAFALVAAALLPMLVAVGVTLFRAERRAQEEARERLSAARRQAHVLIERFRNDAQSRVERAAADLVRDPSGLEALIRPQSQPESSRLARSLAGRFGLDLVEVLTSEGLVLSSRTDESFGTTSPLADVSEESVEIRPLPATWSAPDRDTPESDSGRNDASEHASVTPESPEPGSRTGGSGAATTASRHPIAFLTRRSIPVGKQTFSVVGGRTIDRDLLEVIEAVSGEPAVLVDQAGSVVAEVDGPSARLRSDREAADAGPGDLVDGGGASSSPSPASVPPGQAPASRPGTTSRITDEVSLDGGGWRVRVSAPAPDVVRTRREMLEIFAGIAPFALASALAVGLLLAEGISRPIRVLARRADEIASETSPVFSIPPARDEIRRLTLSFDRMLEARSESEQRRVAAERIAAWQEVARRIAHEVKNPLSPIKLAVENLRRTREKAPHQLDRALEEETSIILEEVESLRRLVDEFSQFARLPRPELAQCDLAQIVTQTLSLFAPRIERDGVRVAVDVSAAPPSIMADPEQIGRALKNVLANALDALEPVSDRRLEVSVRRSGGDSGPVAEIEARDTGVGLEPEALRRIFEPYYTTRPDRGGTGLGMAITHRIVTEHGGTIRVSSGPGRGASVVMRLPVGGPRVS